MQGKNAIQNIWYLAHNHVFVMVIQFCFLWRAHPMLFWWVSDKWQSCDQGLEFFKPHHNIVWKMWTSLSQGIKQHASLHYVQIHFLPKNPDMVNQCTVDGKRTMWKGPKFMTMRRRDVSNSSLIWAEAPLYYLSIAFFLVCLLPQIVPLFMQG